MLSGSPRTLLELRSIVASPARYRVDLEPEIAVFTSMWPCGCTAVGESFASLAFTPCGRHAGYGAADDAAMSEPLAKTA
jgi:hypothetical protein